MPTEEQLSDRLVDQRIRNRIMEAVKTLAEGDEGMRREWPDEYFKSVYDWIPYRDDGGLLSISTVSADKHALLINVSRLIDDACDATPKTMTADDLIATAWSKRVQPVALQAVDRCCQFNANHSPHDARRALYEVAQLASDRHSAKAAERGCL